MEHFAGLDVSVNETIPSVGPVVALTFRVTVDVPARFRNSRAVGAVLGLTPSRHQSGEINRTGAISKCGDEMMRVMLYEAGPDHAGMLSQMVLAQGLGDADRKAPRHEKGNRRAGASLGRHHAPYLGRWHRVPLEQERCCSVRAVHNQTG